MNQMPEDVAAVDVAFADGTPRAVGAAVGSSITVRPRWLTTRVGDPYRASSAARLCATPQFCERKFATSAGATHEGVLRKRTMTELAAAAISTLE
jgi:hypothetical protein